MKKTTARAVMVALEKYPHVPEDATLAEAVAVLEESQIEKGGWISMPRVVLVLGEGNQLLGRMRRRDILRGLGPSFLTAPTAEHQEKHFDVQIDALLTELMSDEDVDKIRRRSSKPVSEVMRPFEATVDVNDSLLTVIREMVQQDEHLLPVLEDGKVVGVARTVDVLREIARVMA